MLLPRRAINNLFRGKVRFDVSCRKFSIASSKFMALSSVNSLVIFRFSILRAILFKMAESLWNWQFLLSASWQCCSSRENVQGFWRVFIFFFLLHEPTSFYMPFAICRRIGLEHHFSFCLHAFKCFCELELELCQKLWLWIKDDDICPVVVLYLYFWFYFFDQQGSAVLR